MERANKEGALPARWSSYHHSDTSELERQEPRERRPGQMELDGDDNEENREIRRALTAARENVRLEGVRQRREQAIEAARRAREEPHLPPPGGVELPDPDDEPWEVYAARRDREEAEAQRHARR